MFFNGVRLYMDIKLPMYSNEKFTPYAILGIALFISGIALMAISFLWKKVQKEENPFYPVKAELYARRMIGAGLFFIGFSGMMWAVLLIPLCLIYGIYLLRLTKRHLFADLIFTGIFCLPFWLTMPLLGPAGTYLKVFWLTSNWNEPLIWLLSLSFLTKDILLGASLALVITDILIFIPSYRRQTKKGLIANLILLLVMMVIFTVPLLRPVSPGLGRPNSWGSSGCSPDKETIRYIPSETFASRDEKNNWLYQIIGQSYAKEDGEILKISGLESKDALISQMVVLGPPFNDEITISAGEKKGDKIIIPKGSDFTLRIFSSIPLYNLTIISKNNCQNSFGFFDFGRDNNLKFIEKIDQSTQIILVNSLPAGQSPGKEKFKSGETFYPQEEGLAKGTKYGMRIIDAEGFEVRRGQFSKTKFGEGRESNAAFNQKDGPMAAGVYTVQLIKVEDETGYIISEKQVTIE